MKEKINIWQKITAFLAVLFPILYCVMYLPVWNGKELSIYNEINILTMLFQVICLIIAVIRVKNIFIEKKDNLEPFYMLILVFSGLILCFSGIFFLAGLFNIPVFPPQN